MQSETGELLIEDPINWSILHKDKLKQQEYADKMPTVISMKPRQHNYLKQLCMEQTATANENR
jgi:hypothetical protein